MTVTKFSGGVAAGGGATRATVASATYALRVSFDPTSATQILLGYLPPGAIPIDVLGFGGTTGGTNPTVDIGTLADDDGYANELDGDAAGTSATAAAKLGALINTQITTLTAVYGKVGASAGTGGTFKGAIIYVIEDIP
jgi:hypothetical protein